MNSNYYDYSGTPYKISLTVSKKHSDGFKLSISVHNFSAFVTSYGQYYTDHVPLLEVDLFLQLYLGWYNPSSKKYETLSDPPEHTPEILMFFVGGESYDEDAEWLMCAPSSTSSENKTEILWILKGNSRKSFVLPQQTIMCSNIVLHKS